MNGITFENKKILVVVAHPDDELLGLGGTLHRLKRENEATIKVVILGEGITSRSNTRDAELWNKELHVHNNNILEAKRKIGYDDLSVYQFPDNRFDSVDLLDIIKVIEKEKNDFQPDIIFTHHGGDLNIDHQRTFDAVITASRPMESETTNTIITFETPSGTEWRASSHPMHFIPNLYVKIEEEDLAAKISGMECYQFEKRTYPHPRSPEALRIQAQRSGIIIGEMYAEAFVIVRSKI
ncbi:PIG-L deacetylase family protein [Crocinitomix algicola]|uniref:PIG-L deacetylase family protein n=1 Tax=Crocinitomix algicola TaxID=1740263 RepID=UPI00082E5352|nr:PIG-L family deacetylase [Crocinitomix algicola]